MEAEEALIRSGLLVISSLVTKPLGGLGSPLPPMGSSTSSVLLDSNFWPLVPEEILLTDLRQMLSYPLPFQEEEALTKN